MLTAEESVTALVHVFTIILNQPDNSLIHCALEHSGITDINMLLELPMDMIPELKYLEGGNEHPLNLGQCGLILVFKYYVRYCIEQ